MIGPATEPMESFPELEVPQVHHHLPGDASPGHTENRTSPWLEQRRQVAAHPGDVFNAIQSAPIPKHAIKGSLILKV